MALGSQELWIVGLIVLFGIVFFGAPKVLEWAKTLGTAQREYQKAKTGDASEIKA